MKTTTKEEQKLKSLFLGNERKQGDRADEKPIVYNDDEPYCPSMYTNRRKFDMSTNAPEHSIHEMCQRLHSSLTFPYFKKKKAAQN